MGALWLLDIDDVLLEFFSEFVKFYNGKYPEKHGKTFTKADFHTYDFWRVLGISEQESVNACERFFKTKEFRNLSACHGAVDFVNRIEGKGVAVTARPDSTYESTRNNLDLRFGINRIRVRFALPYSSLIKTSGGHLTKKNICIEEGLKYAVEDSAFHAMKLAEVCERVYLITQPWNVDVPEINACKNIIRVKSLDEIVV